MFSVRRAFARKLSIGILLLAIPIFVVSLGILFTQSRHMIRLEAVGRANSVLNSTMQRISRNLLTIETATNAYSWLIERSLQPDSLLAYSRRVVQLNPHIAPSQTCSHSMANTSPSTPFARLTPSQLLSKRNTTTSARYGIRRRVTSISRAGWPTSTKATHWS